jgi:hypothetical protein
MRCPGCENPDPGGPEHADWCKAWPKAWMDKPKGPT